MTTSLQAVGLNWQGVPVHPVKRTSSIIGASDSQTYALLKPGELTAVTLAGKTLIRTASIIDFLAKAKPWEPDRDRVARAVAARPDVARKAAREAARAASEKVEATETCPSSKHAAGFTRPAAIGALARCPRSTDIPKIEHIPQICQPETAIPLKKGDRPCPLSPSSPTGRRGILVRRRSARASAHLSTQRFSTRQTCRSSRRARRFDAKALGRRRRGDAFAETPGGAA